MVYCIYQWQSFTGERGWQWDPGRHTTNNTNDAGLLIVASVAANNVAANDTSLCQQSDIGASSATHCWHSDLIHCSQPTLRRYFHFRWSVLPPAAGRQLSLFLCNIQWNYMFIMHELSPAEIAFETWQNLQSVALLCVQLFDLRETMIPKKDRREIFQHCRTSREEPVANWPQEVAVDLICNRLKTEMFIRSYYIHCAAVIISIVRLARTQILLVS